MKKRRLVIIRNFCDDDPSYNYTFPVLEKQKKKSVTENKEHPAQTSTGAQDLLVQSIFRIKPKTSPAPDQIETRQGKYSRRPGDKS